MRKLLESLDLGLNMTASPKSFVGTGVGWIARSQEIKKGILRG